MHSFSLGPVAPFDAAACFLAIGMAVILSSWTENYGDPSDSKDLLTQFRGAAVAIASGELKILLPPFGFASLSIVMIFCLVSALSLSSFPS